jgi:hypothetical protein
MMTDAETRRRLGTGARETALARSWDAVLDQLLLTYAGYTLRRAIAA